MSLYVQIVQGVLAGRVFTLYTVQGVSGRVCTMYTVHCAGCFWPCTYIVKEMFLAVYVQCTLFMLFLAVYVQFTLYRVFLAVYVHCKGCFWLCMYIVQGVSGRI